MLYKLYFNNSHNENIYVTTCEQESIMKNITNFVKKLNPNFKIYYIRSWEEKGKTWYDVGSHTEFFFTEEKE